MDSPNTTRPNQLLRRRNSIATSVVVPTNLPPQSKPHLASTFPTSATVAAAATTSSSSSSSSSQSFTSVDFELISIIKPLSYTSLRDLLPSPAAASVQSPKPASAHGGSGYEISISNPLVKQAAWAYLQPMSTLPDASGRHLFHRLWATVSGDCFVNPFISIVGLIDNHIFRPMTRVFDRLLRAIRVRSSR